MKSTLTNVFVIFSLVFFLMSCGEIKKSFGKGADFTNAEEVQGIAGMLTENIKPEMEVIEIKFSKASSDGATFSNNKGTATIVYVNLEDPKKRLGINIDLKTGEVTDDSFYRNSKITSTKEYKGVKSVTNFGCDKIASNVNAAIQMLASEGLDYSGIGHYYVNFDAKSGTYNHKFTLERKTGTEARNVYYDEYTFIADADGNVRSV